MTVPEVADRMVAARDEDKRTNCCFFFLFKHEAVRKVIKVNILLAFWTVFAFLFFLFHKVMNYKIAIASGKGGTGKTTVAVNLFYFFNKYKTTAIQLVDCDVEEPNDAIFFPKAVKTSEKKVYQLIPEINLNRCTYCRKCAEYCEFNAIVVIPPAQLAEINASLCHSCGACLAACNFDAIEEKKISIGTMTHYDTKTGKGLLEGDLKIGSTMQTMVIKELKKQVKNDKGITLFDAPPGTTCPVVATIADTDFVILVAEPTPFGVHDLSLMVELLNEVKKPFGLIINKAGIGNKAIYNFSKKNKIPILGEIPFAKEYAKKYAAGELLENIPENTQKSYQTIISNVEKQLQYAGNNYS